MLQPALFGGLFIGVLSALPVVQVCCCLWWPSGGVLAAYLGRQSEPQRPLTLGRGALAGLLAGIAGAFIWLIVHSIVQVTLGPMLQQQLFEFVQTADLPAETRELLEDAAQNGATTAMTLVNFFIQLFFGGAFAALGGLGGAAFFRRDNAPPALGGPPPPPSPPSPPSPPDGWTP
jgi:hypothetical protein